MNDVLTSRRTDWLPILIVACLLLSMQSPFAIAQGSFPAQGEPAYKNGSVPQSTPGVSRYEPPSTAAKRPAFGERNASSTLLPSGGTLNRQEPFSNRSSMGEASDDSVISGTIEYVDVVDFPALETGALLEMNVREGDSVPAGMVVAKIDDTLLKHQLRQALIRKNNANRIATDTTSIEAADKQIDLTRQRYETTRSLAAKGAKSPDDLLMARFEYERSILQRRAAVVQQRDARGEAELESARASEVEDRIARHVVAARFDGQVVDRYKQQGEWVTAGEPVAKIARMDKLYATALIRNLQFNPAEVSGKNVVVTVLLARDETVQFEGKIVSIGAKDIIGSGNEFTVKAEITNKMKQGEWILRQGSRVSMRINQN